MVVAKNAFFEEKDTVEDQEELALGLLIFLQDSPKAKRNITLNQKSNFCPDSRFFSKTSGFLSKKVNLVPGIFRYLLLFIDLWTKMEFWNSVDKKRGKKMPFAY